MSEGNVGEFLLVFLFGRSLCFLNGCFNEFLDELGRAGGMGSWGGGIDDRFVGSGWVVSIASSSPSPSLVLLVESDW